MSLFPNEVMRSGGELNEDMAQKRERLVRRGGADIGVLFGSIDTEYLLDT